MKTSIKIIISKIIWGFKFILSVNWVKTIYFNFKMLPYSQAKKLPVVFYGKVSFTGLKGCITINAPVKFGMVGFGQKYEIIHVSKGNAQLSLNGNFIVEGHVQFGLDYFVYISKEATLKMDHLSSLGANGKIICTNYIHFATYARIGFESQLIDTVFHPMKNTKTNETYAPQGSIILGCYNYIGNRVSIMKGAKTPNNCTITSNSLLSKDFSNFDENSLIGGIPAKLLKVGIARDWENENLENSLIIRK